MRKHIGLVLLVLLIVALPVRAQLPPLPPAIVEFTSDRAAITLPEAEAGDQPATLAWRVVNLADDHRMALERQELTGWVSELNPDERLTAAGTYPVLVKHPLNFGVPTYRLAVLDAAGSLLDVRYLTIPYEPPAANTAPQIDSFSAAVSAVYRGDLERQAARVTVAWAVKDRRATSNLLFEQMLPDGSAVSVELPRGNLWIASSGSGVVAPVLPEGENRVRLRLRVIDVLTGEIYGAAELDLAISDTPPTPLATLPPTRVPPTTAMPSSSDFPTQIIRFTAVPSPADPLGTVTLSWTVRGAASVSLGWTNKEGDDVTHDGLPLEGTFMLPLPDVQFSGTNTYPVRLIPKDARGNWINDPNQLIVASDLVIPLNTTLRLVSFSASPNPVERGGSITFTWEVENAVRVGITRVNPQGILTIDPQLQGDLPPRGSITVPVPDGYSTAVSYLIGASDASGVSISGDLLEVKLVCPFAQYIATYCPLTQRRTEAVHQDFERGLMIWLSDTREIYVLYDDSTYELYQDTWSEGEPVVIADTPPAGRMAPARGFGKVWVNNPAVRAKLGWATAPEVNYATPVETLAGGFGRYPTTNTFFTFPNGLRVQLSGFPKTWLMPDGS